jgi:mono/diheme cytochrome c family protein
VLALLAACVPSIDPPDLSAATADVERGRYLANHVAVCVSCHSQRDWTMLYGPNTDGRLGAGADDTQEVEHFPEGTVIWTRNITPAALGDWSDGEVARAVASGLSKDGSPLFLNMPYDQFGKMSDDDLASVVAYLRTLPPVEDTVPERVLTFPLNLVVRTMPMEPQLRPDAPERGTAAYGEYLANLASCVWCHSPVDENAVIVPGEELSGGHEFRVAKPGGGTVRSANLTPDVTGLGSWSREAFISRFKGTDPTMRVPVQPGTFNTPMPWFAFSGMDPEDLGAIYDWLKTRPAFGRTVQKYTP